MPEATTTAKRFDGFAATAFWLALVTMVCPIEADILHVVLAVERKTALGGLIATCFFAAVFTPYLVSCRRHWRQPGVWQGRAYLIATSIILALNVLTFGFATIRLLLA